eukprot:gene4045-4390_t
MTQRWSPGPPDRQLTSGQPTCVPVIGLLAFPHRLPGFSQKKPAARCSPAPVAMCDLVARYCPLSSNSAAFHAYSGPCTHCFLSPPAADRSPLACDRPPCLAAAAAAAAPSISLGVVPINLCTGVSLALRLACCSSHAIVLDIVVPLRNPTESYRYWTLPYVPPDHPPAPSTRAASGGQHDGHATGYRLGTSSGHLDGVGRFPQLARHLVLHPKAKHQVDLLVPPPLCRVSTALASSAPRSPPVEPCLPRYLGGPLRRVPAPCDAAADHRGS